MDAKLAHQIVLMRVHGFHAQIQSSGNFFHGIALCKQHENLTLPLTQQIISGLGLVLALDVMPDNGFQHPRAHVLLVVSGGLYGINQLRRRSVLQQVAAGTSLHASRDDVLVVIDG